jgi:hypothetical protein
LTAPHQTIDFRPGGDPSGVVVHDRSGIVLGSKSSALVAALVFSGTPASQAGITEGVEIVAVDGNHVTAADRCTCAACFVASRAQRSGCSSATALLTNSFFENTSKQRPQLPTSCRKAHTSR